MRGKVRECVICGDGTTGTCHEKPVCDRHKVLVRTTSILSEFRLRRGYHRCVGCAWAEAMPATSAEAAAYLEHALLHAFIAGWDVAAAKSQPHIFGVLAELRAEAGEQDFGEVEVAA